MGRKHYYLIIDGRFHSDGYNLHEMEEKQRTLGGEIVSETESETEEEYLHKNLNQ